MTRLLIVLAFAGLSMLAACGGGGDEPAPTAQVPDSASASVDGYVAYLKALVASRDTDGLEPVDTAAVTAPRDDTGEPAVID